MHIKVFDLTKEKKIHLKHKMLKNSLCMLSIPVRPWLVLISIPEKKKKRRGTSTKNMDNRTRTVRQERRARTGGHGRKEQGHGGTRLIGCGISQQRSTLKGYSVRSAQNQLQFVTVHVHKLGPFALCYFFLLLLLDRHDFPKKCLDLWHKFSQNYWPTLKDNRTRFSISCFFFINWTHLGSWLMP